MTKRDYQALARALYGVKIGEMDTRGRDEVQTDLIHAVANVLAADNPRFSRERFIEACETGRCKGMPR